MGTIRVLIIRVGGLGDSLMTLSIIQAIRHHHIGVYIELAGNASYLSLIEGHPMANKVLSWNQPGLEQLYIPGGQLVPYWQDYFASFNWILAYTQDPYGCFRQNLKKKRSNLFLTYPPLPPPQEQRPIMEYLLGSLGHLGFKNHLPSSFTPRVYLREEDQMTAGQYLQETGQIMPTDRFIVAIHPGSGSPKKCWPVEYFAQLCLKLNDLARTKICLIGGPADERTFGVLKERLAELSPIVLEHLPLRTIAALLSRCNLYIGNDSGITHLAAALVIPTIALFGPTNPLVWAPMGSHVFKLQSQVPCSPCSLEKQKNCPEPICLLSISADQVLVTILGNLSGNLSSLFIPQTHVH